MKELGMALLGAFAILGFFAFVIYPNLEYTGGKSISSCTGECYQEYVRIHGTPAEIEQRKRALAEGDAFSSIRGLWACCAACHSNDGSGGLGTMMTRQSSNNIIRKLNTYKNNGEIGSQSALMWGQAAMLTDKEIETIGEFIQAGLPGD